MNNIKKHTKFLAKYMLSAIPYNLREKKEVLEYSSFLRDGFRWSEEKIIEFQTYQLKTLLSHCYENVPYYRRTWNEIGIDIKTIKGIEDLKKLPIIDKEIVKQNKNLFIASNYNNRDLKKINTGGTTSSPLHFFNTQTTINRERAFFKTIWSKYDYNGELCMVIRGAIAQNDNLLEYDPLHNLLLVNTKNFNEDRILEIIQVIIDKKIKFIQAYPSMIYLVSRFINKYQLNQVNSIVKAVFCSSEKMYDFQYKEIKQAFGCNIIDYYGHNERLILMVRENEENYISNPLYGITEVLNFEGNDVVHDGEFGELIGTGFNNYAFPLIRYNTNDIAILGESDDVTKNDKIFINIKEINGRSGDFLKTADGNFYSPTMLEFAIRYINNFEDLQLVQTSLDTLVIYIVPGANYNPGEGENFKNALQDRIESPINIEVSVVPKIDRPENQKKRFLICEV